MEEHLRKILGLPITNLYGYWTHYWSSQIERILNPSDFEADLDSPRFVIEDILSEIEGHGLKNQDNAKCFLKRLGKFFKEDKALKQLCSPFVQTLTNTQLTERSSCIAQNLCKQILEILSSGAYRHLLVDNLQKAIEAEGGLCVENKTNVRKITNIILSELVAKGYQLDELRNLPTQIPDVIVGHGGVVEYAPDEYEGLKLSEYPNKESYYEAVSEFLKNRTVGQRLKIINHYFDRGKQNAYVLMRLNGIKGDIDYTVNEINLYSPNVKKYISEKPVFTEIEKEEKGYKYVNAAVPVEVLSLCSAIEVAKRKLMKAIDFITIAINPKKPITIAENEIATVKGGRQIGFHHQAKGSDPRYSSSIPFYNYMESYDAEKKEDNFEWISKHLENLSLKVKNKVQNSIHWFYKAKQAETKEDILLFNWFAIESLLKVSETEKTLLIPKNKDGKGIIPVIQEICCAVIGHDYFHYQIIDAYNDQVSGLTMSDNYYDVSKEAIESAKLNLKGGDKLQKSAFLNNIDKVIESCNNELVKDSLSYVKAFYQNKEPMDALLNKIREDILMIYRLRNLLVHNASINDVTLSRYTKKVVYISRSVIQHFVFESGKHPDYSVFDLMVDTIAKHEVFMQNYDKELQKLKAN